MRGNTDRYVLVGEGATRRGPLALADAQADPDLIPVLVGIAQGLAWTYGYLAATGWIDWLATLPLEQRLVPPDGTRLLGVHASPGRDDGAGAEPQMSDADLAPLLAGCEADLVCVGHTHWPQDRRVGGVRLVNVGSVSTPRIDIAPDRRASYVLLEADADGYRLTLHRVAYDTEAVIRAIDANHAFPSPDWLAAKFAPQTPDTTSRSCASPPVS
ncbi:MAG TPA: metallophosphoesterase family protein [Chloroflexota bacterium]|nr:metallophosphoesterase family protein [Chloroflexota bacterium]